MGESAGESTVIRALAVGRLGAAACVSEPRFAPAVCGAIAAVAVSPSGDAETSQSQPQPSMEVLTWEITANFHIESSI